MAGRYNKTQFHIQFDKRNNKCIPWEGTLFLYVIYQVPSFIGQKLRHASKGCDVCRRKRTNVMPEVASTAYFSIIVSIGACI